MNVIHDTSECLLNHIAKALLFREEIWSETITEFEGKLDTLLTLFLLDGTHSTDKKVSEYQG